MTIADPIMLAASNPDWLQWANLVLTLILTSGVAWVGSKARKIETLEKSLADAAETMIEQKFEAYETKCKLSHVATEREIADMRRRLEKGDGNFDELGAGEHRLEIKLVAAIGDMKEAMLKQCADRDEVKELSGQVANLAGRFDGLERAIAMDIAASQKRNRG